MAINAQRRLGSPEHGPRQDPLSDHSFRGHFPQLPSRNQQVTFDVFPKFGDFHKPLDHFATSSVGPLKTGFIPHKFSSNPTIVPKNPLPPTDLDRVSFVFGYEKPGYTASNGQYLLAPTDFTTENVSSVIPDSNDQMQELPMDDLPIEEWQMENSLLGEFKNTLEPLTKFVDQINSSLIENKGHNQMAKVKTIKSGRIAKIKNPKEAKAKVNAVAAPPKNLHQFQPQGAALRHEKVMRYLKKKATRHLTKKLRVKYECRHKMAMTRLRYKGMFLKTPQALELLGLRDDPCLTNEIIQNLLTNHAKGVQK